MATAARVTTPALRRRLPLVAAGMALLVLVPGALIVGLHRFDGLYGQDSFAYVDYALGPLTDSLRRWQPAPDFFWPPGYPLVVALVALVTGLGSSAGLLTSLASGASIPIFVFMLARELLPPGLAARERLVVALLAGAVVGTAGQLWQSSVVAMSDTTALAAATLGAWAVCRYARTESLWAILLGAAAMALAIEIRLVYAFAALPLAMLALVTVFRLYRTSPRRALGHLAGSVLVAVLVAIPTIVPVAQAFSDGSPVPFLGQLDVHRWAPVNALRNDFETADGRLVYGMPTGVFYLLQPVQHYWFTVLAVLTIPGLIGVIGRREPAPLAVLLAWPVLVIGFLAGDAYQNTRFFLAAASPVAILAAFGAHELWRHFNLAEAPPRRIYGRLLIVVIAAALVVNAGLAARFTNAFVERVAADAADIRSLAGQVPADGRIISLGATPLLRHDGYDIVELAFLDEESAVALVGDGQPTFVLVDMASMRTQWLDRAPGRAIVALEMRHGLRELAGAGVWHLYAVAPI